MSDRLEAGRHEDADRRALAEGLRQLPVPEVSAGFDERVLAAARQPEPARRWRSGWTSWTALRPVLGGAACSLLAMLALGTWLMRLPPDAPGPHARTVAIAAAVDREVEGVDSATTLRALFAMRRVDNEERQKPRQPGS